jgi:hypothetical protein
MYGDGVGWKWKRAKNACEGGGTAAATMGDEIDRESEKYKWGAGGVKSGRETPISIHGLTNCKKSIFIAITFPPPFLKVKAVQVT